MPEFTYLARDPLGKTHEGAVEATSRDNALQSLSRDGFQVLRLDDASEELTLFPRRIRKNDIIYVTSQLAVMVDTGITLSTALAGVAQQEQNPTLKKLLLDLKSRVESGDDFSAALAHHPRYFDKTFVALIRASERTGSLGEMLDRIAHYLQKEVEMRGKVRASLAYPAVMIVLAAGVTIFLLTYVLPKFTPIFAKRGMDLPTPTVVMMTLSDLLMNHWWAWTAAAFALAGGCLWGRKTETGRRWLDGAKLHAPVIGDMFRKVAISRSIRTLGAMIRSGVPMLDALRLSAEVSGNYHYERLWLSVMDRVTQGSRICDALANQPLFPPTLVQMIGAGEETGRLDAVLDKVSSYYDHEVETSLKTATSLIEPIMITVMGVVVGGIGMSLLLPIFSLSRGVQ